MKKKNLFYTLIILMVTLFFLTACGKKEENKQMTITTTFYPMYYFTKEIVGDKADVIMLDDGKTEIHDYEPSAKDIAQIENSKLFVYNSNDMETFVPKLLTSLPKDHKVEIVEAAKGIPLHKAEAKHHEEHEGEHHHDADPHVWLDPVLAKKEVKNIYDGVIKMDPKNKAYYEKNYQTLEKKLDQLNQDFATSMKKCPNKTFITQHAAFYYLAHQYGLTQEAISGIDSTLEPSPKKLAEIQKYMQKHDIHTIFVESGLNPKIAKSIQEATKAKLATLNTLEQVSTKDQKDGADYFSIMQENRKALEKALQ